MVSKFYSALVLGLFNSFNAVTLSSLLMVLLFNDVLITLKGSSSRFFAYSVFLFYWFGNLLSAVGLLDLFLNKTRNENFVFCLGLAVAIFFLIFSFLNIRDRHIYQKTNNTDLFIAWPFFIKTAKDKIFGRSLLLLLAFALGVVLTLLGNIWPQDNYLFIFNRDLIETKEYSRVLSVCASYSLGAILPSIVIYEIWRRVAKKILPKGMSLIKISAAAIFLAIGLGLIFVILQNRYLF